MGTSITCNSEIKLLSPFSQNNENTNIYFIMQETKTFPSVKNESESRGDSEIENDKPSDIRNFQSLQKS